MSVDSSIIFVTIQALGPGFLIVKELYGFIKEYRKKSIEEKQELKYLFEGFEDSITTIGGIDPRDKINFPYMRNATTGIGNLIKNYFSKENPIFVTYNLGFKSDNNLISVGGPVSHPLTRQTLGYSKKGNIDNPKVPFIFDLSEEKLKKSKKEIIESYDGGKSIIKIPNWRIIDSKTEKIKFEPYVNSKNFLTSDYCLITVVPNEFQEGVNNSIELKHWVISGTHGAGTSVINKLLNDGEIIKEINHKRNNHPYYQAVIRTDVTWTRVGYKPINKLKLMEVRPLKKF